MPTATASYRDVLRIPHVPMTFGGALVGRSAYALVILPVLFAVQASTGSVATAGFALGGYGLTAAFLAPLRAKLIDSHGRRRVLMLLSSAFALLLVGLAVSSFMNVGGTVMVSLAALAGAVAPPIGPTMRVVWAELAREPALFKKALSLDAVAEELLFLAGPALAGIALAVIAPGIALLVPAFLVVLGTALFVSSASLQPAPAPAPTPAPTRTHLPAPDDPTKKRTLLSDRRFISVLLPALVAGLISGQYTVAIPAAFPGSHGAAVAGIALGLFAGGSAIGGLIFGALRIHLDVRTQLITAAIALVLVSTSTALVTNGLVICVVITAAGLFFSPVMIVAYFAVNDFGGLDRKTQATTWVNSSHNLGGAAGSAAAGFLIQATAVNASYLVMGILCLCLIGSSAFLSAAARRSEPVIEVVT